MAAAAGKKRTTSLSLFMETYGLEVEEELSTMATQYWAEGVWMGKSSHEQKEAWMRQIREVQAWNQVRGPAGAVMRETRDQGIKWPHTLVFSDEITIWKKWAAKHEYEELKERAWLEPGLALLRKNVKENWTEKHRNVARKIFLEGGWARKRLFDIDWSGVSQCQACHMEEGTEKHRLWRCPEWHEVRRATPEAFRKL